MSHYGNAYSYFENANVRKHVPATILKGNMEYDQYAVPDTVSVESFIVDLL